jgi:hypothetical protein
MLAVPLITFLIRHWWAFVLGASVLPFVWNDRSFPYAPWSPSPVCGLGNSQELDASSRIALGERGRRLRPAPPTEPPRG